MENCIKLSIKLAAVTRLVKQNEIMIAGLTNGIVEEGILPTNSEQFFVILLEALFVVGLYEKVRFI